MNIENDIIKRSKYSVRRIFLCYFVSSFRMRNFQKNQELERNGIILAIVFTSSQRLSIIQIISKKKKKLKKKQNQISFPQQQNHRLIVIM